MTISLCKQREFLACFFRKMKVRAVQSPIFYLELGYVNLKLQPVENGRKDMFSHLEISYMLVLMCLCA